ncbi:MAG TPA: hypothetical protein VHF26_25575 [Trebonia sp.]|nr:hypothetical protein [Trebonia sp.]
MPAEFSPRAGSGPEGSVSSGALAGDLRAAIRRAARRMRTEAPVGQVTPQSVVGAVRAEARPEHGERAGGTRARQFPRHYPLGDALEACGLVDRVTDPSDRRQVLVPLSAQGRKMLDASRARRTEWLEERLATLDTADLRTLAAAAEILSRISTQ